MAKPSLNAVKSYTATSEKQPWLSLKTPGARHGLAMEGYRYYRFRGVPYRSATFGHTHAHAYTCTHAHTHTNTHTYTHTPSKGFLSEPLSARNTYAFA